MLGSGRSLPLMRVFGIRIGVNLSWFLVLFLFVYWLSERFAHQLDDQTKGFVAAVAATLLFFGSIVLHELGHALAARREGIAVSGIDLFFFGGVMKMSRDTSTPGGEFRVAAAGPLVTLWDRGRRHGGRRRARRLGRRSSTPRRSTAGWRLPSATLLVSFLVTMNFMLLVFNLLPAFPLDGGRIARAAAWKLTGDRARATRFAARIGEGFSWLMIGYGVWQSAERRRLRRPVGDRARLAAGLRRAGSGGPERRHRAPRGRDRG